ncbi:PTS sugar transporter subunit IIA [Planococcus lenghuensis]|uniref:Mannitol-specific phosphotransferase enzyme IIA component n=1 Tax=Planococcus lenghuensis TaxID=2213202 RepID=A0A1Q2L211_9BACL|nr:PTS sugar transporter subunit IIA [Planococcus lenghuensis]AQQ54453.1 PTS mannitol transporter subunit IIA [Planococcus lenghuensis]
MSKDVLTAANIELNATPAGKEEAIRNTGEILVANGYVDKEYIDKMLEREEQKTTYMGNFLAILHGTDNAKQYVHATGIAITVVPEGIDFGEGNTAKVIFGIAGENDEHLDLLANIAIVCSDPKTIDHILTAESKQDIIDLFSEVE